MKNEFKIGNRIVGSDHPPLVIVEIGSVRKEMAMIHEHAVNHNIDVLHIHKMGTKPQETLDQYAHLALKYETPEDVVEWLEEKVGE